ncbi:MAG: hypothetical protein SPI12_01375 [Actinomycetaceae bacterium]|nr:hypothetical protein [Actinomycetaceae bacterium]MDY6082498.1 hypothetical protein [Actinomycetaceae bacterium]
MNSDADVLEREVDSPSVGSAKPAGSAGMATPAAGCTRAPTLAAPEVPAEQAGPAVLAEPAEQAEPAKRAEGAVPASSPIPAPIPMLIRPAVSRYRKVHAPDAKVVTCGVWVREPPVEGRHPHDVRHTLSVLRGENGMVTAELALGFVSILMVLIGVLWALGAAATYVHASEASTQIARQLALGKPAKDVVAQHTRDLNSASVELTAHDDIQTVVVHAKPHKVLPSLGLTVNVARSVAVEPGVECVTDTISARSSQ